MKRWHVVAGIINEKKMETFAEVGVCKGQTAYPVSQLCPTLKKYYLIDPRFAIQFEQHELYGKVPIFEMITMKSVEAAPLILDSSLDGVYIDALHTSPHIDQDVKLWTPKVRPGGVVCGHDYANRRFPDVKRAVDSFYGEENITFEPVRMCYVWIYRKPD